MRAEQVDALVVVPPVKHVPSSSANVEPERDAHGASSGRLGFLFAACVSFAPGIALNVIAALANWRWFEANSPVLLITGLGLAVAMSVVLFDVRR